MIWWRHCTAISWSKAMNPLEITSKPPEMSMVQWRRNFQENLLPAPGQWRHDFSFLLPGSVTVSEVEALHELFKKLSSSVIEDGFISKGDLQFALFRNNNKKNLFANRMFDLFDLKCNGVIEFGEFVRSLGVFHPDAPVAEKIHFAFKLYDLRQTGFIEQEELKEMVLALLQESDLELSDDAVQTIVDKTFSDADSKGDGKIDPEEWREFVSKNPSIIKNMTLPYLKDVTVAFPSFVLISEMGESEM